MDYMLKQIQPGNTTPIIILLNKDEVIVGRKTVASLVNYPRVSKMHAVFHKIAESWFVRDIGTYNNLYVNFTKVGRDMRRLEIGDTIGFGDSSFQRSDGFFCVFVPRNTVKVKVEVIDLEEDEETVETEIEGELSTTVLGNIDIKREVDDAPKEVTQKTKVKEEPLDEGATKTTLHGMQTQALKPKVDMKNAETNYSLSSSIKIKEEKVITNFPQYGSIDDVQAYKHFDSNNTLPPNDTLPPTVQEMREQLPIKENLDFLNVTKYLVLPSVKPTKLIIENKETPFMLPGITMQDSVTKSNKVSQQHSGEKIAKLIKKEDSERIQPSPSVEEKKIVSSECSSYLNEMNLAHLYQHRLIEDRKKEYNEDENNSCMPQLIQPENVGFQRCDRKKEYYEVENNSRMPQLILPENVGHQHFDRKKEYYEVENNSRKAQLIKPENASLQYFDPRKKYLTSVRNSEAFHVIESITIVSEEEWLSSDSGAEITRNNQMGSRTVDNKFILPDTLSSFPEVGVETNTTEDKLSKAFKIKNKFEEFNSFCLNNAERVFEPKVNSMSDTNYLNKPNNGSKVTDISMSNANTLLAHGVTQTNPAKQEMENLICFPPNFSNDPSTLATNSHEWNAISEVNSLACNNHNKFEPVIKNCIISVQRCDDKFYHLPSKMEFSNAYSQEIEWGNANQLNNVVKVQKSDLESSNNKFHLKLAKNRIRSDSSSSESDIPPGKRPRRMKLETSDSETESASCEEDSESTLTAEEKNTWCVSKLGNDNEIEKSPSYYSNFSYINGDSDSSFKSVVLYPSAHVLENLKLKTLNGSDDRSNTAGRLALQPSDKDIVTVNQKNVNDHSNKEKTGKTLLTDPKPFIKRGRGRPREEKNQDQRMLSGSKKKSKQGNKNVNDEINNSVKKRKDKEKSTVTSCEKSNSQKKTIMVGNPLKNNFKIPKRRTEEGKDTMEKKVSAKVTELANKNSNTKDHKKTSTVCRRPENYGSRMGFLTDENNLKIKPCSKRSLANKSSSESSKMKKLPTTFEPAKFTLESLLGNKYSCSENTESKSKGEKTKRTLLETPKFARKTPNSDICLKEGNLCIMEPKEHKKIEREHCFPFSNISKNSSLPREKSRTEVKSNSYKIDSCQNNPHSETTQRTTRSSTNSTSSNNTVKNVAVVSPYQSENRLANETTTVQSNDLSVIKMIVKWNPKWLEEQKEHTKPPPIVSQTSDDVFNYFTSYSDYCSYINSLIALKLWDLIFTKYKQIFQNDSLNWNNFYFKVLSSYDKHGMTELKCEAVVGETLPYSPFEGNIILLNTQENEHSIENCIFGYVTHHTFGALSELSNSPEWRKIPKTWISKAKPHFLTICVKRRKKKDLNYKPLMLAYGICNIKPKLYLVDNLTNFQSSPLAKIVMQPNDQKSISGNSSVKKTRQQTMQMLSTGIAEHSKPKIFLIEGFPGTGKTFFVLELIENLLFCNVSKLLKIFVCTSSESAADEIAFRLLDLMERYSWQDRTVKFVRIGEYQQMHPKIQSHHFERVAEHHCRSRQRKETSLKERLERLESNIQDIVLEPSDDILAAEKNKKLKDLMIQYESLKKQSSQVLESNSKKNWTFKVLNDADVIISTLKSFQEYVDNIDPNQKLGAAAACCIVDEANECSEPELLQCLIQEVKSLILVGDAKRFPLTNRSCSRLSGRQRSMFERLHALYRSKTDPPVFALKEQYRMHSEILKFPSLYFYKNKLSDSSDIDEKRRNFPLKPYMVFDILDSQPASESADGYLDVAGVFNRVCALISLKAPRASIGAVAENQFVSLYRHFLSLNTECKNVEVNSVEGFQSREKDVMIVTVVKTAPFCLEDFVTDEEKFNVTLTRARNCLLLYGYLSSLSHIQHWKALLDDAKSRNLYVCVPSVTNIPLILKECMFKSDVRCTTVNDLQTD